MKEGPILYDTDRQKHSNSLVFDMFFRSGLSATYRQQLTPYDTAFCRGQWGYGRRYESIA